MKYISKAKSTEYGNAEIPLFDKDGNITNRIVKVSNDSILYYADDKIKSGFSDVSGVTCKMVCKFDTIDGEKTTNDIVEIIRLMGNNVIVKLGDAYYSVYKGIATFIRE